MRHLYLDPIEDAYEFYDFDISHHSEDIKAMMTYILARTKVDKIAYVGHSMGTTAFF